MSFFGDLFGAAAMPALMNVHGETGVLWISLNVHGETVPLLEAHDCIVFPEEEIDVISDGGIYTKEMTCIIDVPVDRHIIWDLYKAVLLAEDVDTVLLAEDGSALIDESMVAAQAYVDRALTNPELVVYNTDPSTWVVMVLDENGIPQSSESVIAAEAFLDNRLTNAVVTLTTPDRGQGIWQVSKVLSHGESTWRLELTRKPAKGNARSGFRIGD